MNDEVRIFESEGIESREPSIARMTSMGSEKFILSVNRAAGRGEIEGKAARARGERVGKGASFKFASSVVAKIKQTRFLWRVDLNLRSLRYLLFKAQR